MCDTVWASLTTDVSSTASVHSESGRVHVRVSKRCLLTSRRSQKHFVLKAYCESLANRKTGRIVGDVVPICTQKLPRQSSDVSCTC